MTSRMSTYDGTLPYLPAKCPCGQRVWLYSERLFMHGWIHSWLGSDGQEHRHQ